MLSAVGATRTAPHPHVARTAHIQVTVLARSSRAQPLPRWSRNGSGWRRAHEKRHPSSAREIQRSSEDSENLAERRSGGRGRPLTGAGAISRLSRAQARTVRGGPPRSLRSARAFAAPRAGREVDGAVGERQHAMGSAALPRNRSARGGKRLRERARVAIPAAPRRRDPDIQAHQVVTAAAAEPTARANDRDLLVEGTVRQRAPSTGNPVERQHQSPGYTTAPRPAEPAPLQLLPAVREESPRASTPRRQFSRGCVHAARG